MKSVVALSFVLAVAFAFPADDVVPFGIQNRITGGFEATPNQFPYQVGMQMTKLRNGAKIYTWCGGSLISKTHVLTAAHCLHEALEAVVFLGAHNRRAMDEPGRILVPVGPEDWVIHENYNQIITVNDIAVIDLKMNIPLSNKIQIINLPTLSQKNEKFTNNMAVISGWGRTGDGPNDAASSVLRYVRRQIQTDEFCQYYFPMFKPSQICVDGSRQQSACAGDSGGPLAIDEVDGSKTLIGLTSYGRAEGCQKNFPIAYTRVSAYLPWIAKQTGIKIRP